MHAGLLIAAALLLHDAPPPGPFPFTEGFDTTSPPGLPEGWLSSRNRSPGVNDFTVSASTPLTPPHAVLSTNATVAQELSTPPLAFTGVDPESLAFAVRRSSSHTARVVVEALEGGLTSPVLIGDTLRGTSSTSYIVHRMPLPPVLSGRTGLRIRWRIIPDAAGATGTFRLDDVRITARELHDLAAASLALTPAPARTGDTLTALLRVLNAGREPAGPFTATLFLDADGDSTAAPGEAIASAAHPGGAAAGDTVSIPLPAGRHAAGALLFIGVVGCGADRNTRNDTVRARVHVGLREGAVVFNEVLYAPAGGDPEWVELLNPGADTVGIAGWTIRDRTGPPRAFSAAPPLLRPGEHLVLTRDTAVLRARFPHMPGRCAAVAGFPALNNDGDDVVLLDAALCRVDSLPYLPEWGGADGRSLERIDPAGTTSAPGTWGACRDTAPGTPGAQNSIALLDTDLVCLRLTADRVPPQNDLPVRVTMLNAGRHAPPVCTVALFHDADGDSTADPEERILESAHTPPPGRGDSAHAVLFWSAPPQGVHTLLAVVSAAGDGRARNDTALGRATVAWPAGTLVITEVLYEPLAGQPEFLEAVNISDGPADIAGWTLADETSAGTVTFPGGTPRAVRPGEYLLLAGDSSIFTAFPEVRGLEARLVMVLSGGLGLNNAGDAVVLRDAGGWTVDSVAYAPSWHAPGVDDVRGRSLERITPRLGSNDPRNWSTCARAAGGTPGARNSIHTGSPVSGATLSVAPSPFSPDGDGHEDFTMVRFRLPEASSLVRLRIYDALGRLVRLLESNRPAGPEGEVVWDGLDDERRRVRMGIYLILLEAADARGGTVRQAKAAVVVAGRL